MTGENHNAADPKPSGPRSICTVTREMLPLHCPTPAMSLWDSHPRVFLPIEETGRVACPYCGTQFVLRDEDHR